MGITLFLSRAEAWVMIKIDIYMVSDYNFTQGLLLLAHQTSLPLNISQNVPKFPSITLVMSSSHLIFWHPLFLLPSIFPSIKDFSNESAVHIRWPKHWSLNFSINPSIECSELISLKIDWFDLLLPKGLSEVFYSTTVQKHQFLGILPSLQSISHNSMWPLERIALTIHNFREGDGTPLQYSCLENPMKGGAWWAAVYGVAQSWTRLKWFSSIHNFVGRVMSLLFSTLSRFVTQGYSPQKNIASENCKLVSSQSNNSEIILKTKELSHHHLEYNLKALSLHFFSLLKKKIIFWAQRDLNRPQYITQTVQASLISRFL